MDTDLSDFNVKRLARKNRNDAAGMVAKEVKGNVAKEVFLAARVEKNLADALAIGPVSAMNETPVLLTNINKVPKTTMDAIDALGVKEIVVVGGYLGAKNEAAILLTNKNLIGNDTVTYLKRNINKAYILGGTKVISESASNKIENALK